MCFGSKSSSTKPPPPSTPTTFDYQVANRGDQAVKPPPNATAPLSTFGSELGASTTTTPAAGGAL